MPNCEHRNDGKIFEKIFYINLDRRTDRDENVKRIARDLKLNVERISAVDGAKLDLDTIPNNIITRKGIDDAKNKWNKLFVPLTRGGIGCALSHRNVWKKIIDENICNALILEDDIRCDKDFDKKLHFYEISWPNDYDIIFLGYHSSTIKYINNKVNDIFVKSDSIYGLFGYVVSNEGAKKLLNIFPITLQIDSELHNHIDKLNIYLVRPEKRIIFSDPSELSSKFGTDIQKREIFSAEYFEGIFHSNSIILVIFTVIIIFYIIIEFMKKKKQSVIK